jgi:hypothetical protein
VVPGPLVFASGFVCTGAACEGLPFLHINPSLRIRELIDHVVSQRVVGALARARDR